MCYDRRLEGGGFNISVTEYSLNYYIFSRVTDKQQTFFNPKIQNSLDSISRPLCSVKMQTSEKSLGLCTHRFYWYHWLQCHREHRTVGGVCRL